MSLVGCPLLLSKTSHSNNQLRNVSLPTLESSCAFGLTIRKPTKRGNTHRHTNEKTLGQPQPRHTKECFHEWMGSYNTEPAQAPSPKTPGTTLTGTTEKYETNGNTTTTTTPNHRDAYELAVVVVP